MPKTGEKQIYSAKSQFWLGNTLFKPIDMGGRAVEEGDPILEKLPDRFEVYQPRVRNYSSRVEQMTAAPGEKRSA